MQSKLNLILDHIAIAVTDLEASVKMFEDLGLEFNPEREEVTSESVRTAFAAIDTHANLELLAPLEEGAGPIGKFLEKKGQGIHHLCYTVKNIEEKQRELEQKGYRFIYENAKVGAHNKMVNFIHPKSSGGILIELSESR